MGAVRDHRSGALRQDDSLQCRNPEYGRSWWLQRPAERGRGDGARPSRRQAGRDYKPKKTTYATIQYVDFPAAGANFGKGEGPGGKFLNELARMDALIHVVRVFDDPAVAHPESSIDPDRDIATMDLELTFADLAMIEKRLERLASEMRSVKAGERDQAVKLQSVLERIKGELENEVPVRAQEISAEEEKLLAGSRFMTALPMLVLLNIGEEDLERREEIEAEAQAKYRQHGRDVAVVAGKFEMELNDLSEEEAEEFRESAGVTESGMAGAIRLSYGLLGLISFLTAGPDECRAWTVEAGSPAPVAAGRSTVTCSGASSGQR